MKISGRVVNTVAITYSRPVPPKPGHLSIASPPLALLELSTAGGEARYVKGVLAGHHRLTVYQCVAHSE
jgi:hypothetical protein